MATEGVGFFVDPARCIGCEACVQACTECDTHKGVSMIHLEHVDRRSTTQTVPIVCMHCDSPTCAEVCPADAIKKTPDGVVQSASKPRCIACENCVLACPFGVPKMKREYELMMKCDMCYDRTSVGKKPMCASVCPSQALFYGPREELERRRPGSRPVDTFRFGQQEIRTKVAVMVSRRSTVEQFDVTAAMDAGTQGRRIEETLLSASRAADLVGSPGVPGREGTP